MKKDCRHNQPLIYENGCVPYLQCYATTYSWWYDSKIKKGFGTQLANLVIPSKLKAINAYLNTNGKKINNRTVQINHTIFIQRKAKKMRRQPQCELNFAYIKHCNSFQIELPKLRIVKQIRSNWDFVLRGKAPLCGEKFRVTFCLPPHVSIHNWML